MNMSSAIQSRKLLKLRPKADGTPLVFAPDLGGNVLYCRDLVGRLPLHIAPYALPLSEASLGDLDAVTIEALAQDFATLLKDTWPEGPIHLAGFSFAGLLAFEIARALNDMGRPATHVWLFDTRAHRLHLPSAFFKAPLREFRFMVSYWKKRIVNFGPAKDTMLTDYRILDLDLNTRPKAYWPIIRTLYGALSNYRPKYLANVPVTLFRVDETTKISGRPPTLGWDRLTKGTVHVDIVDGEHLTMLTNDHSLMHMCDALGKAINDKDSADG